jgi:hypothetical protein
MLNLCCIVAAILKMATGGNCSMSGHHYVPTTTKSRDSEQTSFYARYSEKSLKITKNSEQILNIIFLLKYIYFTSFSLDFN